MSKADFKNPEDIKVGDTIRGMPILKIKGLVKSKATYASTFIVKAHKPRPQTISSKKGR